MKGRIKINTLDQNQRMLTDWNNREEEEPQREIWRKYKKKVKNGGRAEERRGELKE